MSCTIKKIYFDFGSYNPSSEKIIETLIKLRNDAEMLAKQECFVAFRVDYPGYRDSALHAIGIFDVLDSLVSQLTEAENDESGTSYFTICHRFKDE